MKKFINFIKKPRNLYLSIIAMLLVVVGLTSISFSYYIEESQDASQVMKVNKIDTFIQTDDLTSDELTLAANTSKTIKINIINNNSFTNSYKLFYDNEAVTVTSNKEVIGTINPQDIHPYELTFTNNTNEEQVVKLGIQNGYEGVEITVKGIEIK